MVRALKGNDSESFPKVEYTLSNFSQTPDRMIFLSSVEHHKISKKISSLTDLGLNPDSTPLIAM